MCFIFGLNTVFHCEIVNSNLPWISSMLYLERYFLQNIYISIRHIYTNSLQLHHKHTRKYVLPIEETMQMRSTSHIILYNTYQACIIQKKTHLTLKGAHATEAGVHTLIQGHMVQSLEATTSRETLLNSLNHVIHNLMHT